MGSNTASSTIKAKKDLKQFVKENKSGFGIYNEHSKILTRNENYFLVIISMGVAGHGRAGLHSDHAGWGGTRHPLLGARRGGPVRPPAARPLHRGSYIFCYIFLRYTYIPLCQIFLNQNFVSWDSSYVDTVYVLYSAVRHKSILL